MNNIIKMYHNNDYYTYGQCYIIYSNNKSILYLLTPDEPIKILPEPRITIDDSNIDTYVEPRGFEKVLCSDVDSNSIEWFNNYERKISEIKSLIYEATIKIHNQNRYNINNVGKDRLDYTYLMDLYKILDK